MSALKDNIENMKKTSRDLEADENPSDFPSFLDVDHRAPSVSVDAFVVKKMRAARGEAFEM